MPSNLSPISEENLRIVEVINIACNDLQKCLRKLERKKMVLLIGEESATKVFGAKKDGE